jgi:DivIVA domain-containing protein
MYWLQLVVIVALLAAVGWLAIGGGGHMSEPMPDRPDLALPNDGLLARTDVDRVRFSVGTRGYRMDEVDDVLDRLAREIEMREERIAELEGRAPRSAQGSEAEAGDGEPELESAESEPVPDRAAAENSAVEDSADEDSAESKTRSIDEAATPVQRQAENEGTVE